MWIQPRGNRTIIEDLSSRRDGRRGDSKEEGRKCTKIETVEQDTTIYLNTVGNTRE
jgi:hypothetical protein